MQSVKQLKQSHEEELRLWAGLTDASGVLVMISAFSSGFLKSFRVDDSALMQTKS